MRSSCMFLQIMVILFITVTNIGAQTQPLTNKKLLRPFNNTISALFVFGDSTVDSGNNNYISTVIKCNFPPYGRDFLNHIPSGRFTNGRLVTDFAASYIGLKELVPPYLDPKLSLEELMTGVSFASAGSGFDPITAQLSGVIPLQKQLEYFKEYKRRLENAIGEERTKLLISKAAFLDLLAEGARLIGVVGVPPLGCLPVLITLNHHSPLQHRECIDSYSAVGKEYNWHLQNLLKIMRIHGTQLVYGDIYNSLNDMIQNPNHYGFDDVSSGCCGSGLFEAAIFCNPNSIVCNNASEYIFWDAVHPTQATYYNLFRSLRPIIDSVIKQ
ncbi:GDSL esterase/lipase At5g45960-like isoform X3 [Nicotiana sylvestris]|uniref:GDSL esterase/lipase At5g45960-like isoform X3 n=1 Tax=Nicotiana sylvestris TaxID=4096 RepID=A0A1U7WQ56_NICSY|nr:PREDICTED: GDSL esterase/lipase At5g45960-like isoform X3 [Nicotiana sylvestris]